MPPNRRDISIYFASDGERHHRVLSVGRPTEFENVVVAVVSGNSPLQADQMHWPRTLRQGAQLASRFLRQARSSLAAPLRDPLPMYDTREVEPNNLAHLLLDILPPYIFARDVLGDVKCAFRKVEPRFQELLEAFDVSGIFTLRSLEGEIIRVRGTRGLAVYDLLGTFDVPTITLLPDIYKSYSFAYHRQVEKIFIARRGARSLLNQAEVERILMSYGYETVYMEDHSIQDQLGLAAQVKHVVAIHGAGMSPLIMNSKISSVIELLPPHVFHQFFPICLGTRVNRYVLLIPEYDEKVQHSGWEAVASYKNVPFAVDLAALEFALEEVSNSP